MPASSASVHPGINGALNRLGSSEPIVASVSAECDAGNPRRSASVYTTDSSASSNDATTGSLPDVLVHLSREPDLEPAQDAVADRELEIGQRTLVVALAQFDSTGRARRG